MKSHGAIGRAVRVEDQILIVVSWIHCDSFGGLDGFMALQNREQLLRDAHRRYLIVLGSFVGDSSPLRIAQ